MPTGIQGNDDQAGRRQATSSHVVPAFWRLAGAQYTAFPLRCRRVRPRRDFLRRRRARARSRRLPCPSLSARPGVRRRRRNRRALGARRGSRHRHGKDLRLSGARAAIRRKGDHLHRHQDAPGPALRPRHSKGAKRTEAAGVRRSAQGPGQLRVSSSSAASGHRWPLSESRRRSRPARDRTFRAHEPDRRSRGLWRRVGERRLYGLRLLRLARTASARTAVTSTAASS